MFLSIEFSKFKSNHAWEICKFWSLQRKYMLKGKLHVTKKEHLLLGIITLWDFPGSSVGKESTCNAGDPGLIPGSGSSPGEGTSYPPQYSWASLVPQLVKNPPAMQETWIRSLGWEDSPGEEKGYPLQYSGQENSMDCIVHEAAKSRTRLSNFHLVIYSLASSSCPSVCMVRRAQWGGLCDECAPVFWLLIFNVEMLRLLSAGDTAIGVTWP